MSICSEFIFNNNYKVFSDGTIISYTRKNPVVLNPCKTKQGYRRALFNVDGKKKSILIHRIIAKCFILNPDNKPQVNHINGIKDDNRVINLEWATESENEKHSYRVLGKVNGMKGRTGFIYSSSKKVKKIKDGIVLAEYPSVKIAGKENNINTRGIEFCIRGMRKLAGGYSWEKHI